MRKTLTSPVYIWLVVAVAILGLVVAVITFSHDSSIPKTKITSACGPYRSDKIVRINNETIASEIPKSPDAYAKGLGSRPCILPGQGMLFVFSQPGYYRFWMKDMSFPIDIIWISPDHKVAGIERDVQPSTYHSKNPFFINDKAHIAQYVLELKANRSSDLHMTLGTPVQF